MIQAQGVDTKKIAKVENDEANALAYFKLDCLTLSIKKCFITQLNLESAIYS